MGVKVITAPAAVLTAAEMRLHLRIDAADTTEDAVLAGMALAAQEHCAHYTGRSIGVQTLELALDAFPGIDIVVPRGPVSSITSIKYIDAAGTEQTLAANRYTFDDYGLDACIRPLADWPVTADVPLAVKVRYVAGSLPAAVRSALLLTVGHLYEHRESVAPVAMHELPLGVASLLDTVRVWSL